MITNIEMNPVQMYFCLQLKISSFIFHKAKHFGENKYFCGQ